MTTSVRYLLPLILMASTPLVAADDSFDPAAQARAVAPFVEELTRVVAHVDLIRLQVDPLVDTFLRSVPEGTLEGPQLRDGLQQLRSGLSEAGIQELYVLASLADLPGQPWFVVAPLEKASEFRQRSKQLAGWLNEHDGLKLEQVGDVALIGHPQALERVRRIQPQARPELADAFQAAGNLPIQLLLLPTDDDRRIVEELLPVLPKEIGGGPSTTITQGFRWAALALDPGPQPKLRLVIQSRDPQAAVALHAQWQQMLPLLAKLLNTSDNSEKWQRMATMLMPDVAGDRLVCTADQRSGLPEALEAVVALPLQEAWRQRTRHQLKMLGLGFLNHESARRAYPAQANYDAEGKPLLSWRVHLLPYMEQAGLYDQFHIDEPWDSDHNRQLIAKMPAVYAILGSEASRKGRTCYLRPIGEHTACPGREAITVKDVSDGTVCTIMVVEADEQHAVVWTKPEDLPYDPAQPAKGLGGHFKDGCYVLTCDGRVHFIRLPQDPEQLRVFFTRDGGEPSRFRD